MPIVVQMNNQYESTGNYVVKQIDSETSNKLFLYSLIL